MGAQAAQWEWMILLLIVLGLLVAELVSVRRAIRRAREQEAKGPPPAS